MCNILHWKFWTSSISSANILQVLPGLLISHQTLTLVQLIIGSVKNSILCAYITSAFWRELVKYSAKRSLLSIVLHGKRLFEIIPSILEVMDPLQSIFTLHTHFTIHCTDWCGKENGLFPGLWPSNALIAERENQNGIEFIFSADCQSTLHSLLWRCEGLQASGNH